MRLKAREDGLCRKWTRRHLNVVGRQHTDQKLIYDSSLQSPHLGRSAALLGSHGGPLLLGSRGGLSLEDKTKG